MHVAVSHFKIQLYLDCKKIAEKPINTVGSISTAGFVMLGKVTRTRGPRSGSAPVSPQRCVLSESGGASIGSWRGWADGEECRLASFSLRMPPNAAVTHDRVLIPLISAILMSFPSAVFLPLASYLCLRSVIRGSGTNVSRRCLRLAASSGDRGSTDPALKCWSRQEGLRIASAREGCARQPPPSDIGKCRWLKATGLDVPQSPACLGLPTCM